MNHNIAGIPFKGVALTNPITGLADFQSGPPVLALYSGVAKADPAGPGWTSGDIKNLTGSTGGSGSGFVAGAASISGGAVTGVAVTTAGSNYPISARCEVTIAGDGTGARGYASINSSGQVASIVITAGGTGYTSVTSVTINSATPTQVVIFDLGPRFMEYRDGEIALFGATTGQLARFFISASDTGSDSKGFVNRIDGNSEAYFESLGNSGGPVRGFKMPGTRFLRVSALVSLTSDGQPTLRLTAR